MPTSTNITLNISQGKYFSVVVDDVDAVQADLKLMDVFTGDASEQMKIAVDQDVLGNVFTSADAANSGLTAGAKTSSINLGVTGTPVVLTKINVLDFIVDMGQVLDEQNAPEQGRFVVIPPWLAAMIKKSDLKDASVSGDGVSMLRNGRLGMIDRFTLYSSNNLNSPVDGAFVAVTNIIAGTKHAISFASQIAKMETLRAQTTFGNIVRGLNVYGYGVTTPKALVRGYVSKG